MANVCVIGLGYVGLPLAILAAEKGHSVEGIDLNAGIVNAVNSGKSHIKDAFLEREMKKLKGKISASTKYGAIKSSSIILVCVPTPVDERNIPDLSALKASCESVAENLKKNQLVIIESTVFPGTTEEIVLPILEKSKLKAGKDFFLAHCPERIDPGNEKWTIEKIPRVLGALTANGAAKAKSFYKSILSAEILVLNSVKAAEAVKVTENSFRDINIAFINELARSFDHMEIDIDEVIKGASTKPFGYMPFYPGPGVGGHCIPVDPYYLIEKAREKGFEHKLLSLSRKINDSMPQYVVEILLKALGENKITKQNAAISVLGVAYKADIDDARESPSLQIIKELNLKGIQPKIYDPFLPRYSNISSLDEALNADAIILVTNHRQFSSLTAKKLAQKKVKVVIDTRNFLDKEKIIAAGMLYKGIGR
ncbi:MAG: nucleotide sugar dehydrogenase [Candidatus Diapherotrites archaeon]